MRLSSSCRRRRVSASRAPSGENATLAGAYTQLQTYKAQIPALFHTNAVLVTSDGLSARIGSLTADQERFMPWRTTDGAAVAPKGQPELAVLIEGVFERRRLLDLVRDFTVFGETGAGLVKIIAGYHQFHAVKRAVASTLRALALNAGGAATEPEGFHEEPTKYGLPDVKGHEAGDKRIGVIWHTQGSGKSLLMAFYAGQLVRHPGMENPTIVVVSLKGSASVDWSHRESARVRMRRDVKRILRKHGYPPDLQDAAVQTVLRQAETLSAS